jgi:hypothetical protein
MINGGHQARRLQTWLWVAVATLILLIMATPQMSDLSKLSGDVTTFFGVPIPLSPMFDFAAYAIVLTVAVAGAVGGLVSGITTARDADDKAPALRAGNQLKLALKPIMGAILALLLLIFTSWAVIEGVVVTNLGMWYLLAFTAGFSERYFFKLLKLE